MHYATTNGTGYKDLWPGRAGHAGGTAADSRLFVEADRMRYRAGIPRRERPERFGDRNIVHRRFSRWAKHGVVKPHLKHWRAQTMTHDYKDGTTTLFALESGTPPRQGIHPFPEKDQPGRSQAPRRACDLRQLQDPQDQGGAGLARQASALQAALHTNIVVLDQPGRPAVRRNHPPANPPRRIQSIADLRLPSRPGSPSATPNRSPSSGPPTPISSSRRMHVPGAR